MAGRRKQFRLNDEESAKMQEGIELLVTSGYIKCYAQLAQMLGASEPTLSHWRTGKSKASLEEYQKVMNLVEKANKFLEDASKAGTTTTIHDNYIGNGVAVHSEPVVKAEAACNALRVRIASAITNLDGLDNDMRQRLIKIILEA